MENIYRYLFVFFVAFNFYQHSQTLQKLNKKSVHLSNSMDQKESSLLEKFDTQERELDHLQMVQTVQDQTLADLTKDMEDMRIQLAHSIHVDTLNDLRKEMNRLYQRADTAEQEILELNSILTDMSNIH